jgi:hypothetical protein
LPHAPKLRAGSDQRDEVGGIDGTPAVLCLVLLAVADTGSTAVLLCTRGDRDVRARKDSNL